MLWGDRDRVLDISAARVFQSIIPNATLTVIENCGHVPMVEKPEETASAYMEFVRALRSKGELGGRSTAWEPWTSYPVEFNVRLVKRLGTGCEF